MRLVVGRRPYARAVGRNAQGSQLLLDLGMAQLRPIPDEAVDHGEVFTRRWVVDLILDLVGYSADRDLAATVAVEPACGGGAFLGPMVERLSASCRAHGRDIRSARSAIRAFDLRPRNVEASRRLVEQVLVGEGWSSRVARSLAATWVQRSDYLLMSEAVRADYVVGNPPYIRLEDVPSDRMAAYRAAWPTMVGRSDIYVGFIEAALRSLRSGGVVGFICADRWMRNQYGRELRGLVAREYGVEAVLTMHDVDAFDEQVAAYPAITVIRRAAQGAALVADTTAEFGPAAARAVATWSVKREGSLARRGVTASWLPSWFTTDESWPAGSPDRLALIEHLNENFGPLEDEATGTRVGIGVATGADAVFVTTSAEVEPDRLLPLSMVRDTKSGRLEWSGHYLVNPWGPTGALVDLSAYPRLRRYFEKRGATLRGRHVATRAPAHWYRTIDKVDPLLTAKAKLLFPDMKLAIHPVLDEGGYYPHHNLYYVISDKWDLSVLGGLLLSKVAEAFVDAYAVKMRGGTLRFQAQYLRRIRVPRPDDISAQDRDRLADAFERRDVEAATEVAARVYGLWGRMINSLYGPARV
jgi:adenine-specific DNA-methyltransferase